MENTIDIDRMADVRAITTATNHLTNSYYQEIWFDLDDMHRMVDKLASEGYTMVSCHKGVGEIYYVDFAKGYGYYPRLLHKLEILRESIRIMWADYRQQVYRHAKTVDLENRNSNYFINANLNLWVYDTSKITYYDRSDYSKVLHLEIAEFDEREFWNRLQTDGTLDITKYRELIKSVEYLTECVRKAVLKGWTVKDIIYHHFMWDRRYNRNTSEELYAMYSGELADALAEIHVTNSLSDNDCDIAKLIRWNDLAESTMIYNKNTGLITYNYKLTPRGIVARIMLGN